MEIPQSIAVEQVTKFDFISDSEFRASLTSDYVDLDRCLQAGAWKAVHVLSGSVIEALLLEYLVSVKHEETPKVDLFRLQLNELIAICKRIGVLSERASDLSTVVRGYRNLIHPGRVLRLKERVDKTSATVAKALVDMVVEDVANARKEKYGYTAEQVAVKLEKDPSSIPILAHILKETNEYERERLILEVIPARYAAALNPDALEKCFRRVFDLLPQASKMKVAKGFVKILKEDSADLVLMYETAFFKASDLAFLAAPDIDLVKQHIFHQLDASPSERLVLAMSGMGKFLTPDDVMNLFVRLLGTIVITDDDDKLRSAAEKVFVSEYWNLPDGESRVKVNNMLADWAGDFEGGGDTSGQARILRVKSKLRETPFPQVEAVNQKPF